MIPFIGAALSTIGNVAGSIISGASSVASGAIETLGSSVGWLGETAIGAGSAIAGGAGQVAGGIIETGAGVVKGAGEVLFGGGGGTTGLTIGEQMALEAEPGYYGTGGGGGIFDWLSRDTLFNAAQLGYSIYESAEQRKLAEKAIEAQRNLGYVIQPAGQTALAPTTSIAIPAAAGPQPPGLFQTEEGAKLIKYGVIILIGFLLLKGVK